MSQDSRPAIGHDEIRYAVEPALAAADFIAVLETSGLAERRPVADVPRIEQMLRRADIIVTARLAPDAGGRIVGVSRAIADFTYCCYLSDLAVDRAFQKRGIGKALIYRTWDEAGRNGTLILLAAPAAVSYYAHIGMPRHEACYILQPKR